MVEIISKRDGARREDAHARRLIESNRATIDRLADHLSNGAYSARKAKPAGRPPEPSGVIIHAPARSTAIGDAPAPFVRIAVNGRVSVVDANSGRQLHHLGDLRRRDDGQRFVLATKTNGFFSPVAADVAARLADLDGTPVDRAGEQALTDEIGRRLGFS